MASEHGREGVVVLLAPRRDGGSCDSWSDGVAVTDDVTGVLLPGVVVRLSGVVVRLSGAHGAEPVVV